MKKYKNIILIISSFLLGGLVMFLLVKITNQDRPQVYEKTSLNKAINKIYNATISIETYNGTALKNTGTGFFYKKDNKYAYILTNEHVINNGEEIKVLTSEDIEVPVELLGSNEYLDLAVLRTDKKYAKQIAIIGNSKNTKIGDAIFVVGSPLGHKYKGTVTSGVLSGKDRMVETETTDEDVLMHVIQFDASINPGNSGGPLLNINGEVIGVCSLKLVDSEVEGMSFAIPIEYAMNHTDALEKKEKIKFPELGVKMADSNDTATLYQNDMDIIEEEGIVVLEDKNNLKKGDIIVKVNNNKVKDIETLKYELYLYKINDKVNLTVIRNNIKRNIKVTLS